jgi:hypothetical protein
MDHNKTEISQDYKDALERYRNMQLPPCPKCASTRTAIVKCGIGGMSLYLAANTPKILLRAGGIPGKYYCRECKKYFND